MNEGENGPRGALTPTNIIHKILRWRQSNMRKEELMKETYTGGRKTRSKPILSYSRSSIKSGLIKTTRREGSLIITRIYTVLSVSGVKTGLITVLD